MDSDWAVRVECDATGRGEDTPKRIFIADRTIDVVDVIDRWLGRDHAYYKVRDADQVTYILRQGAHGRWRLVMLDRLPKRQKLTVPHLYGDAGSNDRYVDDGLDSAERPRCKDAI